MTSADFYVHFNEQYSHFVANLVSTFAKVERVQAELHFVITELQKDKNTASLSQHVYRGVSAEVLERLKNEDETLFADPNIYVCQLVSSIYPHLQDDERSILWTDLKNLIRANQYLQSLKPATPLIESVFSIIKPKLQEKKDKGEQVNYLDAQKVIWKELFSNADMQAQSLQAILGEGNNFMGNIGNLLRAMDLDNKSDQQTTTKEAATETVVLKEEKGEEEEENVFRTNRLEKEKVKLSSELSSSLGGKSLLGTIAELCETVQQEGMPVDEKGQKPQMSEAMDALQMFVTNQDGEIDPASLLSQFTSDPTSLLSTDGLVNMYSQLIHSQQKEEATTHD
jgi:hypothetical protein